MTFETSPGGPALGVTWYVISGAAPVAAASRLRELGGLWIGVQLAEFNLRTGVDLDAAAEYGLCGPVESFAGLIACIERSAHNSGQSGALVAATDQARAALAAAVMTPDRDRGPGSERSTTMADEDVYDADPAEEAAAETDEAEAAADDTADAESDGSE